MSFSHDHIQNKEQPYHINKKGDLINSVNDLMNISVWKNSQIWLMDPNVNESTRQVHFFVHKTKRPTFHHIFAASRAVSSCSFVFLYFTSAYHTKTTSLRLF